MLFVVGMMFGFIVGFIVCGFTFYLPEYKAHRKTIDGVFEELNKMAKEELDKIEKGL